MHMLPQSDYYDLIRSVNWTPKYVSEDELYPESMTGARGIPMDRWEAFDEPFKVTYFDYVPTQREKDSGAYSVKAALERSNFAASADSGWLSVMKAHYGAIALAEYAAATAELRMARFSKAPGNRNMATFGALDEIRHTQIQLYFAHEHTPLSRQWDWAQRALHTNSFASIASRSLTDDTSTSRDALSVSIMLTFAFETGFTNMQFLGLSSEAAETGDHTFASMISSVQTDEARHAQQGGPALKILLDNGRKKDAQEMVDLSFWRCWRLFAALTGSAMDYYTPLEKRKHSFKEFMQEWILEQFQRQITDLGLDLPWYWDEFRRELDVTHHAMQLSIYSFRPAVWWNPAAGAGAAERDWLEEKYPGWNSTFGKVWDVITENVRNGHIDRTYLTGLPLVCNMSNLPICGVPGSKWRVKDYQLVYDNKLFHFGSEVDRWCFERDPVRYRGQQTLIDRLLTGEIKPPTLEGILDYMGLRPGERGDDAHSYSWAFERENRAAAE